MNENKSYRLLYFSGTGNTEYVSKEIQKLLSPKGQECQILSCDKVWTDSGRSPGRKGDAKLAAETLNKFLGNADILIIAYPTYASDIPKPLDELISILPERNGMGLAVISTCTMTGGDCCLLPAKKLKRKGYGLILASYVKMPNNIKLLPFNYPPIKNGNELNEYYESVHKILDNIIQALLSGKKIIKGRGPFSRILGCVQRFSERFIGRYFYKHMFATANCIKCKMCVSSCPMGNITFEHGYSEFGADCCFCLRCYSFCPVSAIQITEKTRDIEKYTRYKGFNNWKPPRLYIVNH